MRVKIGPKRFVANGISWLTVASHICDLLFLLQHGSMAAWQHGSSKKNVD
jgi:hypothetical protein